MTDERPCFTVWSNWAGIVKRTGTVVGETRCFYKVRFDEAAGGYPTGRVRRVRKEHVRFPEPPRNPEEAT